MKRAVGTLDSPFRLGSPELKLKINKLETNQTFQYFVITVLIKIKKGATCIKYNIQDFPPPILSGNFSMRKKISFKIYIKFSHDFLFQHNKKIIGKIRCWDLFSFQLSWLG